MEPTTAIGGALALLGAKDVIAKLLGPTADYLGGGLRDYTKKGCENVRRVFDVAIRNLGSHVDEPGQVPPKVLKEVLNQGYFCDDELAGEYLGGVLASSRTEVGRDDRGAAILALIGRLSSYQLRCHYLFYAALRKEFAGEGGNLGMSAERAKLGLFVPHGSFFASMEFGRSENVDALLPHIMNGLSREDLIGDTWVSGTSQVIKENFHFEAPESGLFWTPSAAGLELFMWAHGISNMPIREFLSPNITYQPIRGIVELARVVRKEDRPNQPPEPTTTAVTSPAAQEPRQP